MLPSQVQERNALNRTIAAFLTVIRKSHRRCPEIEAKKAAEPGIRTKTTSGACGNYPFAPRESTAERWKHPCKNKLLKSASSQFYRLLVANIKPPYRVEPFCFRGQPKRFSAFLVVFYHDWGN
jgi:hypothetical protein